MPYPIEVEYLLNWFRELCRMRSRNGMGFSKLSIEIVAWQKLTRFELTPFELDTIWHLDDILDLYYQEKADT